MTRRRSRAVFISKDLDELRKVDSQVDSWIAEMGAKLREDMFAGEQVPKYQIPKSYLKMGFNNVYRYKITKSVRGTYTIVNHEGLGPCPYVIWIFRNHKDYEKNFGY